MENLNSVRRLIDIKPKHVSLVDKAANLRQFILIKKKGELTMEEVLKALGKIEDAINSFADKHDELNKRIDKLENNPLIEFDTDKAGAKFSKSTLDKLRNLQGTLSTMLKEYDEDDTSKNLSMDDVTAAIHKGIESEISEKEEKKDNEPDLEKMIAGIVTKTLESVQASK